MSAFILDWRAAREAGPVRAGGKGWQLACLAELGGPVPEGFVIDAKAGAGRKCGEPLPATVVAALSRELMSRGWTDQPLAVRSSACGEDSPRASFAGIFNSFLNVRGLDACVEAVRQVWDSWWSPVAHAYRQRLGIDSSEASMAVVVMPLIPAVAAGVAFTCDPLTGREDQLVIHANWGLGEALVAGKIEPDEYRLQEDLVQDRLALVSQHLGSKQRRSVASSQGGTLLQDAPVELASKAVLSAAQALTLGALVQDVAFALDYAMPFYDVEFVFDGQRFWIVQARPITARGRYTYPALAHQPAIWSRGNSRDVVPDPLSPMDWSLVRGVLNRMLTRTHKAGGYETLPGVQRITLRQGRLYFETSVLQWEAFDGFDVPPKSYNQLLGGHQPEISLPKPTLPQRLARAWRSLRFLLGCIKPRLQAKEVFRRVHRAASERLASALPADNAELARQLRELVAFMRGADDLFLLQAAGSAVFVLLDLLEKYFPEEGQALTAALMAGGDPSVTAAQAYELMQLGSIAAQDPIALSWLRSPARVGTQWCRLPEESPFRRAFADFLQRYGHRAVYESYLRNPRWREAPDYLLDNIASLIGSDLQGLRERQESVALQARQRVRRGLPGRYRSLIPLLVKFATVERNIREGARSALIASYEVGRRYALALGAQLRDSACLTDPSDIFNLTFPELVAVAEGRLSGEIAGKRASWRRSQLERYASAVPPEVIVEHGDGVLQSGVTPAVATGVSLSDSNGELWRGTAVGSGLARGSAHVARHPTEALGMLPGAILVTPATDPSWTPVFLKAGALVMETGGFISHGAIVAREFGIPAVVNLPGILDRIGNGDPIEVDGNRGTVRRSTRPG
jgi:pyruvate,water dikinase